MNQPDSPPHLSEEQLVQSVVDEARLAVQAGQHLQICPQCQASRSRLAGLLNAIGPVAARRIPAFKQKRLALPEQTTRSVGWQMGWRPALALAVVVLMVGLFVGHFRPAEKWRGGPAQSATPATADGIDAAQLMIEISAMSENALPQVYQDISNQIASDTELNNTFFQFIVPTEENEESLGTHISLKGVELC